MPSRSMLVGLREAETLPLSVRDQFGSYGDMFERLISPIAPDLHFRRYASDQGELPQNIDECDAYVVTGSRHNAYDTDPWIEDLKSFIRQLDDSKHKCIGICFGHQLVAQALGGKVQKSARGWGAGVARFEVCAQPAWLSSSPPDFNICVSHQDQVIELPPAAQRFARSEFCPNGGYFIGDHIFCLQGHPEFSGAYVRFLIEKRFDRIGEDRAKDAIRSLDLPVESARFRRWLGAFLSLQAK